MYSSCSQKQQQIIALFKSCETQEARYQKIIELGRALQRLESKHKTPENLVQGCQSAMYLFSQMDSDNKLFFQADSEALISAGLAAILLKVYNGEAAETVLQCPPDYLEHLGIRASLTPSRANGLYSIHLRMKQDALKLLVSRERS